MPTIDHTSYPTIMDKIIAHASMQALFKLRLTSTAFRARVDAEVGKHALLSSDSMLGVKNGGKDRNVLRPYLLKKHRFSPGPKSWALSAARPTTPRVVDIHDALLDMPDPRPMLQGFPSISTVRRLWLDAAPQPQMISLPSGKGTVVDFITLPLPPPKEDIPLSSGNRHIIHLRVGDVPSSSSLRILGRTDIVTVVLWRHSATVGKGLATPTKQLLLDIMRGILSRSPLHFTVVGVEGLETNQQDVLINILKHIGDTVPDSDTNMKTLTLNEWWAELEEGEKNVIGMWPSEYDDKVSIS